MGWVYVVTPTARGALDFDDEGTVTKADAAVGWMHGHNKDLLKEALAHSDRLLDWAEYLTRKK